MKIFANESVNIVGIVYNYVINYEYNRNIKETFKAIVFTIKSFVVICYLIIDGLAIMAINDRPLTQDSCADPDCADLHSDIVQEAYHAGNSGKYVWDER